MTTKAKKAQTTTTKAKAITDTPKPTKFVFSKKHKLLVLAGIATTAVVSLSLLQNNVKTTAANFMETQIKTPVIARTELSKKSNIDIKLFDDTGKEIPDATTPVKETSATTDKTAKDTLDTKPAKADDLQAVIKNLTAIELAQVELKAELTKLKETTNAEEIKTISGKVAKLESLNGNIGNLSKIFLAQQLVLLDNAFKVGGNQNVAIKNIHSFASTVAKDEKVATKLNELLTLTNKQAIITPQALLFYAQKLESVKLKLEKKPTLAENASFADKIKHLFQSFIVIRKTSEVTAEQKLWLDNINELQKAIIFNDYIAVETVLANKQLQTLGAEDFANFSQLFKTYLAQQQALQAALGAFIEGYNYDY